MRLSHIQWIVSSGSLWLLVGVMLLTKGIGLMVVSAHFPHLSSFLFSSLASRSGSDGLAALSLVTTSLFLGFIKGRFILSKTVERTIFRILSFPSPVSLKNIYTPKYYLLIGTMVGLGLLLKWVSIPPDLKGVVDIAIGSALINGAVFYFRHAVSLGQKSHL